jgi:hypothetical protein
MNTHLLLEAALRSLVMGAIVFVVLRVMRIDQVRARRTAWLLALVGALAMQQADFGAHQGVLGVQQGELGAQQSKLGEQQALLGEQQRKIVEDVRRQLKPIIEQAIREGKGKALTED